MREDLRSSGSDAAATDAAIAEAAAEWFLLVREGELTTEQLSAWLQWLEQDERHARAFDDVEAVWHGTAGLASGLAAGAAAAPAEADDYDGSEAVTPWLERARKRSGNSPRGTLPDSRRRWFLGLGLAASVAAIATLGAPLVRNLLGSQEPERLVLETRFGENRTFELPDGSRVAVGGKSLLLVTLGDRWRDVSLERGEAFFSVAKDATRPFTVRAGHTDVTAVGTAFNVRRTGDRVVVAVAEGIVKVTPGAAYQGEAGTQGWRGSGGEDARLRAGERAIVEGGISRQAHLGRIDARQVDGWRSGRLQYENEPLAAIVADLSRYSSRRIDIADADVGNLRITGTVFEDHIDGWLATLQAALPVRAVQQDDGSVRLEMTADR